MGYTAVTVEGGLFPSDLLDRIATGEAEGQRAVDFGLDGSRRLVDEIQSAFSDARSFWDAFQRRLERSRESRTTITREDWVVPFLELLGFYNLQLQRASLEAGGESFFISHVAGDEPGAPPVHIVALDQDLDRRNGARRSPHALVQDYLNRSDALWGIVTNGRHLRLLRDSARLSKPTYLEFDLEGMIASNLYSEFVLLYRLLHASRFPRDGATAHECLLERYYQQGIDEGGRVRDKLRDGVQAALEVLGTAFLAHPDSGALRDKFARGQLDAPRYYRQLLRLVYRLLFLMVAEERRLIFPPDADATRQAVYTKYYSVTRLRDRAERYFAGDENGDLWVGLRQTFRLFRDHDAAQKLGLSALDGELFGPHACEDLEGARCTNEALLSAVRHLSTFVDDGGVRRRRVSGVRRRVNYAGLDVEEFGSVYESLLDYHPQVTLGPPRFDLVAGSERKQTGSYYTPPQLVHELIESALVPVMEKKLRAAKTREEKERALLDLRVCDPAAGSGHFLLAAARRIARELAKVRSGEDEPAPDEYRRALRDVIRQCVYAVDKNPLAVDLCKVALWIEGHNAGLPLSFLDHHVKCGDSLVGVFDLKVLEEGIPDEAYKPVTGDDKAVASTVRKRNKLERQGQLGLAPVEVADAPAELAPQFAELARREERAPDDVHAKEQLYERLRAQGTEWWKYKVACDLWTAAFFTPLTRERSSTDGRIPTSNVVRKQLGLLPDDIREDAKAEAIALSQEQRFFHWPLEFPDVFKRGGFDAVLGNPPFMGGLKISENFGDRYANFLGTLFAPSKGRADLSAYFYRRVYQALAPRSHLGMVATNTIGQGETRETALAPIVSGGGTIVFAHRFITWPGAANVEVNLVAIRKGSWEGPAHLDGEEVSQISSRLDDEPEAEPVRLHANRGKAFQGNIVLGDGFILDPDLAQQLLDADPRNADCLFPYLSGDDLNSRLDQSPSRWVIQFDERSEFEARRYPLLWEIVESRVYPDRKDKDRDKYPRMVEEWWKHWNNRRELYRSIRHLRFAYARSRVSEMHMLARVQKGWVYSDATVVIAFDDDYHFAVLQSSVHEAWVRRNASTMRTDVRYTPTDCFETFPFPQDPQLADRAWAERIGAEYYEYRQQLILSRNLGLTRAYNLFHDPECADTDIGRLRELHVQMDEAILACYGWRDLEPKHSFYPSERGHTRHGISPDARREILRRLTALNLEMAEREQGMITAKANVKAPGVVLRGS